MPRELKSGKLSQAIKKKKKKNPLEFVPIKGKKKTSVLVGM